MNQAKTALIIIFTILVFSTAAISIVDACSSNSDIYAPREITINVQPAQPILVQRYQAPNIRIFCFGTEQTGGIQSSACPSSSSSKMVLCSRKSDAPDALSTCEAFAAVTGTIERGSINGADMIWDVMWDGTDLAAQCFPRRVRFSFIVLVRGAEVASIALFVVLVIIAILVLLLAFCSLGVFVRQRINRYDAAGAISMAGPKGNFAGHQFQVRGGAAGDAQAAFDGTVPSVFLPVRSNGMGSPLYGADGQELDERQLAELAAMNAEHDAVSNGGSRGVGAGRNGGGGGGGPNAFSRNPNEASRQMRDIAKKGASPPRPGDAIEGFEGVVRDLPEYGYAEDRGRFSASGRPGMSSGGDESVRRRRGGGPRGARERVGPNERRAKALFPTHYDWEKNDGFSGFGNARGMGGGADEYGNGPERFDRDGSGVYYDENGNPYYNGEGFGPNASRPGVRYIPQWMHSFHARDEAEGGEGDHFDPEDGLNRSDIDPASGNPYMDQDGAIPVGKSRGQPVSELGVYTKGANGRNGNGARRNVDPNDPSSFSAMNPDETDENAVDGMGRKVRFAPGSKNASGRNTPTSNGRPGANNNNNGSSNNNPGGKFGNSRNPNVSSGAPGGNNSNSAAKDGDNFNRNKANTFGKNLQLGKNRDFNGTDGGDGNTGPDRIDVKRQFNQEDYTTTVIGPNRRGAVDETVLQCTRCKALLDGTAPRFCAVTGERH